jgi:predicted metal-dependent peptidase
VGGGGTDFCPFFTELESVATKDASEGVAIYLTDGHGRFPAKPPRLPVLWVVVPGGLPLEKFPFGETVRMVA